MAVMVVDLLEVVKVDEHNGELVSIPLRPLDLGAERFLK
jgi:hypothetical protein